MVVGYGRKKYFLQTDIFGVKLSGSNPESDNCVKFDHWKFYQNRLARVMPLYYFDTFVLALPLLFVGFCMIDWETYPAVLVVNIIPVTTLLGFFVGAQLDGPAWTICTLLYMWLLFPFVLPRVQRMTDDELIKGISNCYWFQFVIILVLLAALIPTMSITGMSVQNVIGIIMMHPVSRFPVFLMGVYAGELCVRHSDSVLPWPSTYFRFFPKSTRDTDQAFSLVNYGEDNDKAGTSDGACADTSLWRVRVTKQCVTLSALTFLVFVFDTILQYAFQASALGEFWFQGIVAFAQLELVVALTRDGGATRVSKWFRTSVGNWLGDRSMAIYLVHWPLLGYLCFMIYGKPLPYPRHYIGKCEDYHKGSDEYKHCEHVSDEWLYNNFVPAWGIPVILVWVLILADLTHRYVEEPCRKLFRSS